MFSKYFIDRPIFASVISLLILLVGGICLPLLPVEKTPDITPPTVVVETFYPGANAEVVAETVATPLEEAINGVDGMIYMSSSSSDSGYMGLTVTFEVGTDIDMATVLVQNRVAMAEPRLPEEVKRQGITTQKQTTNMSMVISFLSPDNQYDEIYLSNYINLRVKDVLSRVPGVGKVEVFGGKDFGMRIWLDPAKLKARQLTTADVLTAIRQQNVQVAPGQIGSMPSASDQQFQYTIKTLGRLSTVEEFEDIIVRAEPGGRLLRVKDIARVELGSQNYYWYVKYMGASSVAVGVYQTPGANALNVVSGVKEALAELSESFPAGVEVAYPYNPTQFIEEAIHEVVFTLLMAVGLVVLTVYVFLQDWRATLVPAVTIPVSLIGTFAVMLAFGMSINTLTLFGLVLAIGIVVDDAIVVVENAVRIIEEEGLSPKAATAKAMGQVTSPIIATTLVLLSVFVPTILVGGITGRLYQQFAVTISIATVFSSINALTLSPALCGLLLRPGSVRKSRLFVLFDKAMKNITNGYTDMVRVLIRKTAIAMILFVLISVAAVAGYRFLPTGFLPTEDEGSIFLNVRLPDGSTLLRTEEVMRQVETILKETPGVQEFVTVGGFSMLDGTLVPSGAICFVNLDPWSKRPDPSQHVQSISGQLQARLSKIPEASCMAFSPPPIMGLGMVGGFELRVQDRGGAGLDQLARTGQDLALQGMSDPHFMMIDSNFRATVPQVFVDIDRVKAKTLDVPLETIFSTLETNLGSTYVNDFNLFGRTFKVIAQAEQQFRAQAEDIRRLEVRNQRGDMLPLSTLAEIRDIAGPQIVNRYNMYPSTTISGAANFGTSSGQAIELLEKMCAELLPSNMGYEWSGLSYQEIQAGSKAGIIFLLAAVFAYLFLAAQYESWTIPLAIILAVPLGLLGAVVFTWIRAMDNNIYTQVGIVLLIGLASKTAILLIEFAKQHHEEGHSIDEAALAASRLRFRPILMTALTFVFGTFPLVIATGAGAGARRALGTSVFGGMLMATLFGVLLLPVFYVVVQRTKELIRKREQPIEGQLLHRGEATEPVISAREMQ